MIVQEIPCSFCCPRSNLPCRAQEYVIFFCNANAVIDDNFDLYLNGHFLDSYDGFANACLGRMFTTNNSISLSPQISVPYTCCAYLVKKLTISEDKFILPGMNKVEMRNTKDNGYANWGAFKVLGMSYDTERQEWIRKCTVLDSAYSGAGGQSFTFDFYLERLVDPDPTPNPPTPPAPMEP